MAKNHLKRLSVPRTWAIPRKKTIMVARPRGYLKNSLPVSLILQELLKLATTRHEVKRIVQAGKVKLDGITVKDERLPATLMSVLSIEGAGEYRMLLNKSGKLHIKELKGSEAAAKPCKITAKTTVRGNKTQLTFHDGRTMLAENKDAKVNDTFVFRLPGFKAHTRLKLDRKATAYLIGGSNVGSTGTVENVAENVTVALKGKVVETGKENVFIIDGSVNPEE